MTINILVFAKLQEQLGISHERLDHISGETADEAFERIQAKYANKLKSEPLQKQGVRVAINESFTSWATIINDGDEVAFIPPVAGG